MRVYTNAQEEFGAAVLFTQNLNEVTQIGSAQSELREIPLRMCSDGFRRSICIPSFNVGKKAGDSIKNFLDCTDKDEKMREE